MCSRTLLILFAEFEEGYATYCSHVRTLLSLGGLPGKARRNYYAGTQPETVCMYPGGSTAMCACRLICRL